MGQTVARVMIKVFFLAVAGTVAVCGHALPTPVLKGPLRVSGDLLFDATGNVELAGVNVPDIIGRERNEILFKVIRRRWNLNAVRLPVSVDTWVRDGDRYISSVALAVEQANAADLAVVLVARDNESLPSPRMLEFWRVWAARFRTNQTIIFDVFDKPTPATIPGRSGTARDRIQWDYWLNGGTLSDGRAVVGMKQLVDAIRSAGANQVTAVQTFSDKFGFQGFDEAYFLSDPSVIYEIHPYFDRALTTPERDSTFGFLARRVHVYADEWGLPLQQDSESCRRIPRDVGTASAAVTETLRYFAERRMSWTAASFEPGSLISDFDTYSNTKLDRLWTCGDRSAPALGMGEILLLAMTGDPTGFGELVPEFIANAATGMIGPVAPGEIIAIYGVEIGPFPGVSGEFDELGNLRTSAGKVRVIFDGVAAPVFFASAFQVNVQVPYSVAGKASTVAQLFYDEVPSSRVSLPVVPASPGIFAHFSKEAKALNQDGAVNSAGSPAAPGSVIVLFGTGAGALSVERPEGNPAALPLASSVLPVSIRIGSVPAEVLYAGEAPGLIGVLQLNVRVPAGLTSTRAVNRQVDLSVGSYSAMAPVTIWVK